MRYLQEHSRVEHVLNASKAIKEERASSPNLVIKQEPGIPAITVNTAMNPLFRTVTENGQEIIELLDSDHEMTPKKRTPRELRNSRLPNPT